MWKSLKANLHCRLISNVILKNQLLMVIIVIHRFRKKFRQFISQIIRNLIEFLFEIAVIQCWAANFMAKNTTN